MGKGYQDNSSTHMNPNDWKQFVLETTMSMTQDPAYIKGKDPSIFRAVATPTACQLSLLESVLSLINFFVIATFLLPVCIRVWILK